MTPPKKKPELLVVEVLEAKPNALFTEQQRAAVRFLRFNQSVPCAECGKRRKVMWTMLCSFYAYDFNAPGLMLELQTPAHSHLPLAPVCGDHPLSPAWPAEERNSEGGRRKTNRGNKPKT